MMDFIWALRIVLVSLLVNIGESTTWRGAEPYCSQLGCDQAGCFTQDEFKIPIKSKMEVSWVYKQPMMAGMNDQNNNYGCVGSSEVVVCPYRENMSTPTRHVIINPDTGEAYDFSRYATVSNVGMPILVEGNLLFAVNSSHASLIDTQLNRTYVRPLLHQYPAGVHSPIYLPELEYLLVFGNLSEVHLLYKVIKDDTTGASGLTLLGTVTIEKTGKDCNWLPFSEIVANGNRIYFYGVQRDEITGIVAVDFFPQQPHYKKAWELSDESSYLSAMKGHSSQDSRNCSYYPQTDPDYSMFPAVDVNTQLLATPDNYVVTTTPVGLLAIKDHGGSGEQVYISLFGAHFLSLDTTPERNEHPPIVWMTGWSQYPAFRENLIAFNYSDTNSTEPIWIIVLGPCLGAADINVTSRITSFPDPTGASDKVLVFGVSVNTTSDQAPFHQKYCPECKPGINKMLMAVHSSLSNTPKPDILWMTKVPSSDWEVRGQVIGVGDKLITFLSDGKSGNIAAFS